MEDLRAKAKQIRECKHTNVEGREGTIYCLVCGRAVEDIRSADITDQKIRELEQRFGQGRDNNGEQATGRKG